ncbi:hypothetical protein NEILACOT_05033 [Neisseria lactamica ATCC 23970]|uniref:Uncharacterized protein n=1 Tax=Neisseria lactamica ATCC 23970 TaxID=546265 RepID=D0WBV6_NEILA|nr:hypothetical protein NEILACOT_05033 [Neisseria lactamica ATCC 23970]
MEKPLISVRGAALSDKRHFVRLIRAASREYENTAVYFHSCVSKRR